MKTGIQYVYITNSNFNRLVYALAPHYQLKKLLSNLDFEITDILNSIELAHIENFRRMLKDKRLSEILETNNKDLKVGKKFFEVFRQSQYKPPAMHGDLNCQMMRSDYKGLSVPIEIQQNSQLLHEYIQWSKDPEIINLVKSNRMSEFYNQQEAKFKTRGELVPFTINNSGVASLFTLEEINKSIIRLLNEADEYRNSSPEHHNLIKTKGYGTNRDYVRNSSPILNEWHFAYKKELMNLIKSFYRVQTNPTLEFDRNLLAQVGFSNCRSCI
jgi:hypothetical protein